ncbi:hypothetical protein PNEG_01342 [Pneumocystis murina B123]|uniref:NudC domain-containing protein 1 n=1 Tax=Pneumocystis murina (strain B123) TaxID=1069680 RepID=M7NTN7_PNEMU|nr:hypothetical protein PNEG_01342 [Pneumocystis murina B123]EMR10642.1 hypothetical protein PNEG_01342 [Pneumocystis murina B123]
MNSQVNTARITLKLARNTTLLHPKFESYKLRNDKEILSFYRLEISHKLSKLQIPSYAKIGYYEWKARLGRNHLRPSVKPFCALYISEDGVFVELFMEKIKNEVILKERIIATIHIPKFECRGTGYDDIYPYFPDLKSLTETLILATDGAGKFYFIDSSSDPVQVDMAVFSTEDLESHPFIILDAVYHSNIKIQVLIAHLNGRKEKTNTKSRRYLIKNIMCEKTSTSWELSILNVFFSKEIPIFSQFLGKTLIDQTIVLGVQNRIEDNLQKGYETLREYNEQLHYTWIQTSEDIRLFLTMSPTITKQDISIKFSRNQLEGFNEDNGLKYVLNSKLYHTILPSESTWTLSTTPLFPEQILEICMKKENVGLKWPHIFENNDNILELENLSDRTMVLKNLLSLKSEPISKIKSSDNYIIDYENAETYFLQQFKEDVCIAEISGITIVGSQFTNEKNKTSCLAIKYDVDALIYNIESSNETSLMNLVHSYTFPALSYISSSKISKKYLKYSYTGKFAIIVESGVYRKGHCNSQNLYLYWNVFNNQVNSYQSVIKIQMEALGLCQIGDHEIIILGENEGKPVALLITNL